jgi:eukaryotic-like serine/threonine-protein kinase
MPLMAAELTPGDTVERYRIESLLGEGGVAAVYRVRHVSLGTVHALKVLVLDHPRLRERLIREGKLQASLQHPNLVPVRDVIELSGSPALLMDFVPDGSLQDLLDEQGQLPFDQVDLLFRDILAGMKHAHDLGVIHRDLKPANILLEERHGRLIARVADFGIARHLVDLQTGNFRTRAGMMGTPEHMAPEQARDARNVDERADVFSLGSILFTMVCGRPPFLGSDAMEVLNLAAAGEYPDPAVLRAGISPGVHAVIRGCLQPDRERRLASCDAVEKTLEDQVIPTLVPADVPSAQDTSTTFTTDDLKEEVAPAPVLPTTVAQGQLNAATAACMVVDHTGQGHVVDVVVIVDSGEGAVTTPSDVARDTEVAAQVAVAAALGQRAEALNVRWAIRGSGFRVHGTSVGLAVAVAATAAFHQRDVPEGWAFTGGVDLDGRVVSVSGVPAKVRAALLAEKTRICVPAADSPGLVVTSPHRLVPVDHITDLLVNQLAVQPPTQPWKRWVPFSAAMTVLLLLTFTNLLGRFDAMVQYPLVDMLHGDISADNTVVLGLEPTEDLRALRPRHGEVMEELAKHGAKAVVLDTALSSVTDHDEGLAAAIRRVKAQGVEVVVPIRFVGQKARPPGSEVIRDAATLGVVQSDREAFQGSVRLITLKKTAVTGEPYWHAAVLAAAALVGRDVQPTLSDELRVGPLSSPVSGTGLYLHPFDDVLVLPYDDPSAWRGEVRGKAVVIGLSGGTDDVHRTPWGTVWGPEIIAAGIETILRQAALRKAPVEIDVLLALLTGLGTAGIFASTLGRRRWLAMLVPVSVLAVTLSLLAAGWLLSPVSVLIAGFVGTFFVTKGRRGP